jgi:hypothetical protein
MAVGDSAIQTWDCRSCGVRNVQDREHCSNCHDRASHRRAAVAHIPAMDLEEFCAKHAKDVRLLGAIEKVGVELYLTLTPPTDPPRVFLIANENGVVPCDNFGRPSW